MKATDFIIKLLTGKTITKTGYVVCRSGLYFGIHKQKSSINSSVGWHATELSTGRLIPFIYTTRKNAISGIEGLMDDIKEAVKAIQAA